jgi:septum formation protein
MTKIISATGSPYRKKAFECLGLEFVTEKSNIEECFDGRPDNPEELVKHLAKLKAETVAKKYTEGIIIGFDSVGWFDGRVLEKPKSKKERLL